MQLEHDIATTPVLLLGLSHMRCTLAAQMTLQSHEVCVEERTWEDPEEPQYRYMQCLYPDEIEGTDTAPVPSMMSPREGPILNERLGTLMQGAC